MKKLNLRILLGILLVGSIVFFGGVTERYIEVNAMTGASRTKTQYGYIFTTPWNVRSNWVAESAARQGISTEEGWQQISLVSRRLIVRESACGRAPASYPLGGIGPDVLNLTTREEIDHFVHDFIFADETKRKELISNW